MIEFDCSSATWLLNVVIRHTFMRKKKIYKEVNSMEESLPYKLMVNHLDKHFPTFYVTGILIQVF
jgi:hypothetical protein